MDFFVAFVEDSASMSSIRYFDQSVKNAGVAFVKGANERNEFFEKI